MNQCVGILLLDSKVGEQTVATARHCPRTIIALGAEAVDSRVLYALTFTPVVYIAPTRELSVLITMMMGAILFDEGHLRQRLIWVTLILLGAGYRVGLNSGG